jgi:hypothetical protein
MLNGVVLKDYYPGIFLEGKSRKTEKNGLCPRRDFVFFRFLLCILSIVLCHDYTFFAFCPYCTKHKHPCSRRDSNPQPQQVIGRRPSP